MSVLKAERTFMNKVDRAILVGMVLGDSYIKTTSARDKEMGRHPAAQICFGHSIKQKEYLQHKIDIVNKMFGGNATLRTCNNSASNGKKYGMCYANKSNPYFKTLKKMMYKEGKKFITRSVLNMLSVQGIAMWFMDDGSQRKNYNKCGAVSSVALQIATYCSKEEIEAIILYFKEVYGITWKKAYDKRRSENKEWSLRANTSDSKLFSALISRYIVPSMEYKLLYTHNLV